MDIQVICEYIIDNINENINVQQISKLFHYNKSYLMRKFKDYTGFTINEFINECRVYNSTDPLIYTDDKILKIALTNGFNSLEYYSEKFKEILGTSPFKFRQIYSSLLKLAKISNNPEELKYIKNALGELHEYQLYLNNIGNVIPKQNEEIMRPKVKTISSPYSKTL